MKYLGDNKSWNEDEEVNLNWETIKISRVDDKIIKVLVNNLKSDISDDFFLSFESLLKLARIKEFHVKAIINELEEIQDFRKELFKFFLDYDKNDKINYALVPQLFSPDFITRARAIMRIDQLEDLKYLKFIIPLIEDPDPSVRWAVINLLTNHNQIKEPHIYKKLKKRLSNESNEVILERLKKLIE